MFVKLSIVSLIALVTTSAGDDVWNGFVASWDADTSTHFYDLPKTQEAALNEGWTSIQDGELGFGVIGLGYIGDPTVVLLFKDNEFIGLQVAFRVLDVLDSGQPIDYDSSPAIIMKTINEEEFYTATVFIYKNEKAGIRRLTFKEKNGYFEVPSKASEVTANTPFLMKNCIPTMGIHYYTWHSTSDCATLYPWVLLSDGEDITGLALQGSGNLTTIGSRVWWETLPPYAVLGAVPDAATCIIDATAEFGAISLHVWFVNNPEKITCN